MAQSPHHRGVMDSYYRRDPIPHKWLDNLGAERVEDLTEDEKRDYYRGYNENDDRKEWE